jgi:paraquat-inducible protein A
MQTRNKIAYALTFISLLLLYPGISRTMLTITMNGKIDSSFAKLKFDILDKSNSIIKTVDDLYQSEDNLVASLILLFSIIIPIIKALLIISTLFIKKYDINTKIFRFIKSIGKWSMADVFVVAIFLAYLSTKDQITNSTHQANLMGLSIKFSINLILQSKIGSGFYFFLAYCLTSLSALQIFSKDKSSAV